MTSRLVPAVVTAALVLAGCSTPSDAGGDASSAGPASTSAAGGPKALKRFYDQKLTWTSCDEGECAWLTVPIDYAKPGGPTIKVAVNRVKASGQSKGALVVNPGGPGGSGVDYAAAADRIVTPQLRSSLDVVGFDPRGVQRSAAITCVDDATLDRLTGSDPSPDTKTEQGELIAENKSFGEACKRNAGPLLGHVSTVEVAKDLDVLRAALGERKLTYLGKSYGTFIGATYADLFPQNVGRIVVDGVMPPDLTMQDIEEGQATGFERALDSFLDDCAKQQDCPLPKERAAAKKKLQKWLQDVDSAGIAVHGDARVTKLTEGWAVNGVAAALYAKTSWGTLRDALHSAFAGNGDKLFALAKSYASRNSDGTYDGNGMQVINAVTCLDRPAPPGGVAELEKEATKLSKVAPTWGTQLAWAGAACEQWPVKPTGKPHTVKAAGAAPILVVGTTRDPATPYEWSQRLAKQLDSARLLTYIGDGHTAYGRTSDCVNTTVDRYLLDGTVPKEDVTCSS